MNKHKNIKLHEELEKYINNESQFSPYYAGMNILMSEYYEKQLKVVLELIENENPVNVKSFAMYLETIIINMHTKAKKYKKSIYFNDENIKDIENQGCTIPFYYDEKKNIYVLLGLIINFKVV